MESVEYPLEPLGDGPIPFLGDGYDRDELEAPPFRSIFFSFDFLSLFFLLLTFFCSSEPPLLTSTEVRWSATSCSERELNLSSPSPDLATEPLMMIKAKARAVNQINHPGSPLTLSRLQTV
jgi:hypothetical protein